MAGPSKYLVWLHSFDASPQPEVWGYEDSGEHGYRWSFAIEAHLIDAAEAGLPIEELVAKYPLSPDWKQRPEWADHD